MKQIIRLGAILFLITAISAGALSLVNDATKVVIQENAMKANLAYMEDMLPDADEFTVVENPAITDMDSVEEAYEALQGGNTIGYAFKTTASGYGGDIEFIISINADGTLAGMRVASHAETPGLGAKIAEADFQSQFEGKSTENELELNSDIEVISGATISTRAATNGVNAAIRAFEDVLK